MLGDGYYYYCPPTCLKGYDGVAYSPTADLHMHSVVMGAPSNTVYHDLNISFRLSYIMINW